MVSSPESACVFICDRCIRVCADLVATNPAKPKLQGVELNCSFCSKELPDVKTLCSTAGGDVPATYICDECVDVCVSLLGEDGDAPIRSSDGAGTVLAQSASMSPRYGPELIRPYSTTVLSPMPSDGEPVPSEPVAFPMSLLKRISLHVWANVAFLEAMMRLLGVSFGAGGVGDANAAKAACMRKLFQIGAAVDRGYPQRRFGKYRAIGYYVRAFHLLRIVNLVQGLADVGALSPSAADWASAMHFLKLALAYCEAAAEKFGGVPTSPKKTRSMRERLVFWRSQCHVSLAKLLLDAQIGDISRNLDAALEHYQVAADLLDGETTAVAKLAAQNTLMTLATAELGYPTENRSYHARQAIKALLRAKETATPLAATMVSDPLEKKNPGPWDGLPSTQQVVDIAKFSASHARARMRARRGSIDPFMAGLVVPYFLAQADWHLGVAYREVGDTDKAVEHFQLGLAELTVSAERLRAPLEADLGYAYLDATIGDTEKNLRMAIESFKRGLAACEGKHIAPKDVTKVSILCVIGDARARHSLLVTQPKIKKNELAALARQLRSAARLARETGLLQSLQEALYLLGKVYASDGDSARSYYALFLAARVSDRLQRPGRTPRMSRFLVGAQAELDDLLIRRALNHSLVSQKNKQGGSRTKPSESLTRIFFLAERSRTRFLQKEIGEAYPAVPRGARRADIAQLFAFRRTWQEAELRLLEVESKLGVDEKVLAELQNRRKALEARYRVELERTRQRFGDPNFDPDTPAFPVNFAGCLPLITQYLVEKKAALVEYHINSAHLTIFVLLPKWQYFRTNTIPISELDAIRLRWAKGRETLQSSGNVVHWEKGYLNQVLDRLMPLVDRPTTIVREWEQKTGKRIERFIVVPHRFLHSMPLHAVPLQDGTPWGDAFAIQYAPSASVLWRLLRRQKKKKPSDASGPVRSFVPAVAVAYSPVSGDHPPLVFSGQEVQAVAEATGGVLLEGTKATADALKEAMDGARYVHFACHGLPDTEMPLDAGLLLAPDIATGEGSADQAHGPRALTLADILQGVRLARDSLVVLSACETGLVKVEERHEEYLGLPAGFLCAGAATVVSSLWKVNDVATWLFMRAFARDLMASGSPLAALRAAQRELRELSRECVVEEVARAAAAETDPSRREEMSAVGRWFERAAAFPFAGPYWWAGFTVNGLV